MAICCNGCRHLHEQGAKCPICGHTGKSRLYKCFKINFIAYQFTVQRFDGRGQDKTVEGTVQALERANMALWAFVKILREKIFSNLSKVQLNDPMSRHLVSFVGDGPMGIACWRPVCEESGNQVAVIEHVGIVKARRRQGYAKRLLRIVVEDIEVFYAQAPTHPQALVAYVPQNDSGAAVNLFRSLGFQPLSHVERMDECKLLEMRVGWGCRRLL
ncbi:putative GNAT domain, acyl-CoA N-acyltransferase [Plasmopara halstedii]